MGPRHAIVRGPYAEPWSIRISPLPFALSTGSRHTFRYSSAALAPRLAVAALTAPIGGGVGVSSVVTIVLEKELTKAKLELQRWTKRVQAIEAALTALRDEPGRMTIPKRQPMSASERQAVSRRMKRYWAKRRGRA